MIPVISPICGFFSPAPPEISPAVVFEAASTISVPADAPPHGIILQRIDYYKVNSGNQGYPDPTASLSDGFTQIHYRTWLKYTSNRSGIFKSRDEFIIGYRMLDPSMAGTTIGGNISNHMVYCILPSNRPFDVSIALAADDSIDTSTLSGLHIIVGAGGYVYADGGYYNPSGPYDEIVSRLGYGVLDAPGGVYNGKVVGALAVS